MNAIGAYFRRAALAGITICVVATFMSCNGNTQENNHGNAEASRDQNAGGDADTSGQTANGSDSPAGLDWANAHELTSNAETYTVEILPPPDAFATNEPFDMTVRVTANDDETGALSLNADAAMPHHGHGMNQQPKVSRLEDNVFRVTGMLLHMPGRWEMYFDITRNGRSERAQLVVHLE